MKMVIEYVQVSVMDDIEVYRVGKQIGDDTITAIKQFSVNSSGFPLNGYRVIGNASNVLVEIINLPVVVRYKRSY